MCIKENVLAAGFGTCDTFNNVGNTHDFYSIQLLFHIESQLAAASLLSFSVKEKF